MSLSDTYRRIAELQNIDEVIQAARHGRSRAEIELTTPYVAPATPDEVQLAEIWRAVLQVDAIGVDDNFFELSGDSLTMTQVLVRLRERCGYQLPIDVFFEGPTIRELASALAAEAAAAQACDESE